MSADDLEDMLYYRSGLLGVSGLSADVAELLASPQAPAREAIELYTFLIARHIVSLAVTLGGLDRLVFTGGVGQHVPEVRRMVVRRLAWLGVALDDEANARSRRAISADESRVGVEVIPTDEEGVIAAHVRNLLWTTG